MNPIVKWVLQTMMKGQTGVVRTLPNKKLLDINVNMTVERLIKNGIDPSAIKTPGQVDNIIKQIEQPKVIPADSPRGRGITEALFGKKGEVFDMKGKKIKPGSKIMGGEEVKDSNVDAIIADIKSMDPIDSMKEANSVIGRKGKYKNLTSEESKKILQDTEDHIFERDIPDPEDMATGGRAGFKLGSIDKARRAFLKAAAGVGGGIAALKTGLLGLGGKQATKQAAKEIITTPSAAGKPAWFDALVTRVVNEGEDVTKKFATKDREIVHATKIDDDAMVTVYRDLDDGTVRVDIDDATTNVMGEQGDSVVSLEVRGGQLEEGVKGKTPVEFEAREADYRNYMDGPDDYTTETIDNVVGDTKDLTADLTKVKMYAKGQKKPTIKEMMIQRDRAKTLKQAEENPAEYAADRGPDIDTKDYDYASGGIARMIGE